jgi:hypothetical protein
MGDQGIDGLGIAPISPVLSSRVAVQVKRCDPSSLLIVREVVHSSNVMQPQPVQSRPYSSHLDDSQSPLVKRNHNDPYGRPHRR